MTCPHAASSSPAPPGPIAALMAVFRCARTLPGKTESCGTSTATGSTTKWPVGNPLITATACATPTRPIIAATASGARRARPSPGWKGGLRSTPWPSANGLRVMDSAQDSHGVYGSYTDALAVGDASLFEVCAQDNPTGSIDFINKYIARYPAYREGFWETAANCGFQMDNTAPLMVTNLSSTSHTAGVSSPDPTVTFTWTRAYDNLSGIQGYGLYISSPSPGLPADTQDIGDVTSYTTEALSPGTYYFNIRSVDNAGNWDGDYAHWGPIVIREAEPADLTPYLPPGWDYELVPCDDDDSITSSAEVPDYLPGNTTLTYWNMRGINQGDVPTSVPFNGALNVDGEHVQSVNWGTVNAGQQYQALNIGPIMVPGGRHSFTCRHDSEDNIPETDENNNVFGRQFIWTPLTVAVNSTRGRPAPPTQTGGWNEVTSGTKWYNSDGLRMFTNEGWWHAMAVWANDNQLDVDARLHAASQGAENGFANYLGYSSNWAGELDIVVANRNMNNAASWDVGVLAYGNPGSYKAYHARSSHVSFGDSLTVALSDGEPMLLREFYLYDSQHGPVSVTAQCSTGGALHLVVMHRNYATGTATSGNIVGSAHSLDGSLIRVSGDLTETGWYGILVYGDPTDGFPARDITIEVGTTPPDLAVRLPSPWWYAPIVPRPAWDGSPTVCLLPDTLYAAPNPTYLNVAAINNGPVSSPLPSRVYRDGSYAGYVNWGTLAPGTQVTYNWDHEFIWTSGRHTLSYRVDALQEIEETNENNNIYGEQYVWGPSEMLPGAFTVRPAPPAPYNGYGDVSGSNNPFFANCDGLRLAGTGTGYWKAMAIRPEGTSDFDLRVHDPAVGSQDGYKTALFGSYGSGQVTEYILMNYNAMSLQDFDVGVTRWDGNDSYRAHAAKSSYYGNPDPSYTGLSIMANRLVAMYEFSLDDGDWSIELENLSGDDLGLAIHKDGEPFHNRYTAYGVANTNGAGGDETLVLPMVENDYYCVVVYRADDSTDRADFNLHFNAGLSPVGDDGIPQVTRLVGAYPNPFNPQTQIDFDLSRTDHAQVVIYDAQGRVIRHLVDETLRAGHHSAVWMGKDDSGRQVASGVYFARLESRSGSGLTKLVLVK
ncbi:hypothetical protein CSA17_05280 [bacterium DOLJORAL78_65_58]|nr:MAG: hypothetical protein CSA17_05280 [bacterium DOLJORAL78_65_58]